MTATILPFRKPSTPQVNQIAVMAAQYFIGVAIVGIVMKAWLDSLIEGNGG